MAGLVGRPLAIVRARLWLEIKDDVADLAYPDDGARAARQAAYDALGVNGFPVRVGELTDSVRMRRPAPLSGFR